MFPAREHLCMALPSGPPTPLFPAVSPYPCPAYRSPVCLPGYIPSHLIAWKTAHPHRGSGSKSPFVRVVKARKRNSFSIESLLSEDKFEVSDDKEPQLRRGPLPIVASQIQKGGSSSHVAEFNVWKNAVQGRDDGGIPNKDALYVVHNFEDMVKHYRGTMTVSDNSDISDSREVSRQIETWRLNSSVHQKSKRVRTIFTSEQLQRLERVFEEQQYMVGAERSLLASDLQLSEAQVKVWFQNRRIKWRKESHEKARAKLADYRSRRDDIRRKLGLSQRRTRFVADDMTKKKATENLDVMADEPIDALHNDGGNHE